MGGALAIGAGLDAFTNILTTSMTNSANNNINKDNIITQILENEKNRKWQSEENRKANEWQEKMWNAQNDYNTPLAQRQRLQAAGYNPWISGSGGPQSLAGSAGAGAHGSAAQVGVGSSVPMVAPSISGFASTFGAEANIANQNAKTMMELLQVYDKARQSGMSHDDAVSMIEPSLKAIGGMSSELNLTLEDRRFDYELKKQQKEFLDELNPILVDKTREEKALIVQEFNESAARIGKMASDAKVNEAEIDELVTRAAKNLAERFHFEQSGDEIRRTKRALARRMLADAIVAENESFESNAEFENREAFRNWLRSPRAKQKRMMSEIESGNFNERVAKIKRYSEALGVNVSFDGSVRDFYSRGSDWNRGSSRSRGRSAWHVHSQK